MSDLTKTEFFVVDAKTTSEEWTLEVLGAPYGGPEFGKDAHGEYFSPRTDFAIEPCESRPVYYFHGDSQKRPTIIGKATMTRRDEKGRHATTRRDLIEVPQGGLLIDTPGMREFGLIDDAGGVGQLFADIVEIAANCRFSDCNHQGEPGCAVLAAVDTGDLDARRFESYQKLQREIAAAERRRDPAQAQNTKRRWKSISKAIRQHYRSNPKRKS